MEHMGYVFKLTASRPFGLEYYECNYPRCKCIAKKSRRGQVTIIRPHNHGTPGRVSEGDEENATMVELEALKSALQDRAIRTTDKMLDIYKWGAARYPRGAAQFSWRSARLLMGGHRRNAMPEPPDTLDDLEIQFRSGSLNRFCMNGDYVDTDMTIQGTMINCVRKSAIFVCRDLLDLVLRQNPDDMYIDSSFRNVPKKPIIKQLLSVHFIIDNINYPVIYCLMEGDDCESYNSVFSYIQEILFPHYSPRNIFSDMNEDLITPLRHHFENSVLDFTWFHHNQSLCTKITELGYSHLMKTNALAFKCLKMLMMLPLLPANQIQAGFDDLKWYAASVDVYIPRLFDFYNWHWLTKIGPNNLSMFSKPKKTTNNIVAFQEKMVHSSSHKSTIWKLLGYMCYLSNLYWKLARDIGLRNSQNRNHQCQSLCNHHRIKSLIQKLVAGEMPVRYYLMLSVEEFFDKYANTLRASIVKMPVHHINLNDESEVDVDTDESDIDESDVDIESAENASEDSSEADDVMIIDGEFERRRAETARAQELESQHRLRQEQRPAQQALRPEQQPREQRQREGQPREPRQQEVQRQEQRPQPAVDDIMYIGDTSSEADSTHSSEADDQSAREQGFCMVCLTRRNNDKYIIVPCGHSWMCQSCRDQNLPNCPYCRNEVLMFVRVLETSV